MSTTSAPPTGTPPRGGSGARTALLVIGGVVTVLGAGNLAAAGAVAAWSSGERDDGFYTAGPATLSTDTYALVVPDLDVSAAGPDAFYAQDLLGELRIETTGRGSTDELFVGIGRAADVAAYVDGMAYEELRDFEVDPFRAETMPVDGDEPSADPGDQDFWVASTEGSGTQTLDWEVRDGDWTVVAMNADASSGVELEARVGASLPFVTPVAILTLVVGLVLLAAGIVLLVVGLRTQPPRPVYEARPR